MRKRAIGATMPAAGLSTGRQQKPGLHSLAPEDDSGVLLARMARHAPVLPKPPKAL